MIIFFTYLLSFLFSISCFAETLAFKQPLKQSWTIYLSALMGLITIIFSLIKKKNNFIKPSSLVVIDKKRLNQHTTIYVIHYKDKQFILADNQHAITLEIFGSGTAHEP